MLRHILRELRGHAPFTVFGAITGVAVMLLCYNMPPRTSYTVFYVLHPLHVVLSALVTASIYKLHRRGAKLWPMVVVGYLGSIGIATISDSIIPYVGEVLLPFEKEELHLHLGFIEEWWLVNPAALLGIGIAYLRPKTKFPHGGHVLLSTWASSFHIIMVLRGPIDYFLIIPLFAFLFLAVWAPCCLSDIVFPILLIPGKEWK